MCECPLPTPPINILGMKGWSCTTGTRTRSGSPPIWEISRQNSLIAYNLRALYMSWEWWFQSLIPGCISISLCWFGQIINFKCWCIESCWTDCMKLSLGKAKRPILALWRVTSLFTDLTGIKQSYRSSSNILVPTTLGGLVVAKKLGCPTLNFQILYLIRWQCKDPKWMNTVLLQWRPNKCKIPTDFKLSTCEGENMSWR